MHLSLTNQKLDVLLTILRAWLQGSTRLPYDHLPVQSIKPHVVHSSIHWIRGTRRGRGRDDGGEGVANEGEKGFSIPNTYNQH